MSSKNTWLWIMLAAALFGFIYVFERYFHHPDTGPKYLLPGFDPKTVTKVQVRPGGLTEIHAQRTNGGWRLVEPVNYPADDARVEDLLEALKQLRVVHHISEQELRKDPKADEDYGIDPPQISLIINSQNPIHFGHRTMPGDQVFVRMIGLGGVYVVDSEVLKLFPKGAKDWRETALADFTGFKFDHVTVTNTEKNQLVLQLERNPTNNIWSMTLPMKTRADSEKVEGALKTLEMLRAQQFVSDDPKVDLEALGLQPAETTIALAQGTNTLLAVDFGKALTNSSGLVYARRHDQNTIIAVSALAELPWQGSYESFRDRHLVSPLGPLDSIEVHGQDTFSLHWQTNGTWHVMPQDFVADSGLAAGLARTLSELQVEDFEKDSVTEPDLPHYGLAPPARKYILTWANTDSGTNPPTELDFGTNSEAKIFARRAGEDAVYRIAPGAFEMLPTASWEMHDRHIWDFKVDDVTRITVQDSGQTRQIERSATSGWALTGGAQGAINVSAIEDTVRELGALKAFAWVGHGSQNLSAFGLGTNNHQITFELKKGDKLNVQFGGSTRFGSPYASVTLNNEPWIFEFPPDVYPSIQYCLSIPAP